jgi:replicative DNA helicase
MVQLSHIVERTPPFDQSAEQSCIGAIILEPSVISELIEVGLRPHHFYDDANRILFGTLAAMHEAGCKLDVVLITSELKRSGKYEAVGGGLYLAKLADSVPSTSNAKWYASVVRETWAQRTLIEGAIAIASDAATRKSKESSEALTSLAESVQTDDVGTTFKTMQDACLEVAEQIDRKDETSVRTGLSRLDSFTRGGLKANQLTILAAATSVGKSAFAIEVADNAARAGKRVLYVTLEMTGEEIVKERLLPRHDESGKSTKQVLAELATLPITFIDRPNLTIGNIRGFARLVAARGGLDC